jgi:four helix bundle protein
MLKTFRSYQLAVNFYKLATKQSARYYLKNQLERAASSIALNLAEGSAKDSAKDRRRFYQIALGSTRECESIVQLLGNRAGTLQQPIDILARHVYKLVKSL